MDTQVIQKVAVVSAEWDVVDLIESIPGLEVCGFFDPNPQIPVGEFPYLGNDQMWEKVRQADPDMKIALALDDPKIRARLFAHYEQDFLVTLTSPHAYASSRSSIGTGSIVQRGATVMAGVHVGQGCKINVNASVHHDAIVGNFSTLAPGSLILGNVVLEDQVYVGAGAIVRQRCRIGRGAVIGAGAVVVRDVPAGATVVGVPADRRLC